MPNKQSLILAEARIKQSLISRKLENKPYLSVVIPCYNEIENIERGVLGEVFEFFKKQKFSWEVIVSDDGSTDESRELVKQFTKEISGFRLLENNHGGKPYAIWEGIKEAKGEFVLFADMDQSTPIKEVLKLIPYFKDYSVIIGSRGIERKNFSLFRKIGSTLFRLFRQSILLRDIFDTQCGFKVFKTETAKKIFPQLQFFKETSTIKGWKVTSFDVELLFIAEKFGDKIKEVPVEWEDRDVSTGKDRSYLKESKEMLQQIIRVKRNDMRGLYENK